MSNMIHSKSKVSRVMASVSAACAIALFAQLAVAAPTNEDDARSQAKRMYDRIAGVPPDDATLTLMAADITGGSKLNAALRATDAPEFYSVTLKNFVTPWTNRDQSVFAPLNDYTATVIGMVRDDKPFNTALSADILYTSNAPGLPAVSVGNNDHYAAAETQGVNLKTTLVETTQSAVYGIPAAGTAGLITTRAASQAFFIAGTNRAMFRFTLLNHLCRDMEEVHDTTRPPDRIRQDVSRSPGGDSRVFLNNCIGCHSGMDPMAQAFAYYNYDETPGVERLVYTPGTVAGKYRINMDNFKPGFITPDDSWENRWREGPNKKPLDWNLTLPATGSGAKSLGQELAASGAFAQCQVTKVFKAVCLRAPDNTAINTLTSSFKANGYKLKQVFAESAAYCAGGTP